MMDPVSDIENMDISMPPSPTASSPPPPPPASSPPPPETLSPSLQTPPVKPKKARRCVSPTKEQENCKENGAADGEPKENGDVILNGVSKSGKMKKSAGDECRRSPSPNPRKTIVDNDTRVQGKVNCLDFNGGSEVDKVVGHQNDIKKSDDVDDCEVSFGFGGGVAKIVGEIEKFNSIGKRSGKERGGNPENPARKSLNGTTDGFSSADVTLDDVQLRDKTPDGKSKNLSPIEKSVLRELPVDVEIENEETVENRRNVQKQRREPRRHNSSAANNSNRNSSYLVDTSRENGNDSHNRSGGGSAVKRTPTMEFKKQCSKIVRIRTKLLQNLGKADKTTDEVFDEYEANFTRQQTNANRLYKEVTNYLRCARALHGANKALFDTLSDVYEPDWAGHDLLYAQAQNSDMLWTDFVHKLQDQSVAPLTAYQIQFPELRKKIDKRGRKLVDYDSQRHQLEALQRSNRRDEYKLARCKDQLELARTTYDSLNKELYEELPGVYDQRVPRTAETLQTLYAAEATFMRESSKIAHELEAIADKLNQECTAGQYRTSRGTPITPRPVSYSVPSTGPTTNTTQATWFTDTPVSTDTSEQQQPPKETDTAHSAGINGDTAENGAAVSPTESPYASIDTAKDTAASSQPPPTAASASGDAASDAGVMSKSPREEIGRPYEEIQFEEGTKVNGTGPIPTKIPTEVKPKADELYDIPIGATTSGLPQGVLYQVRTTYKYEREDVDELSFDVGEIVNVVEYEDPEEQEEGWLSGYKVTSNEKGLFPANFTRPI